ncbi:MAG TPA: 2-phospho-L-lactate transferase [Nitrososphaerales archaeon]|nr:2-phospho-L-lactate transferase [Nitrososphaerales archaeon]
MTALAGGTGSARLLRGLYSLPIDLTVVANVGDNIWMHGLYVCPDIDIAMYTLAGIANPKTGWGIARDTFRTLSQISQLGGDSWFRLGDKDIATSVLRTAMLSRGMKLTAVTERMRKSFGLRCKLLPATDQQVETRIITPAGDMHLQEFWVREKGEPEVKGVRYRGANRASINTKVRKAISGAERIVICPANPITSIGPMLAVGDFARELVNSAGRVVALSPMVGDAPVSGPAGKLMKAVGKRANSVGVASMYQKFVDCIVLASEDQAMKNRIVSLGMDCVASETIMKSREDEQRLARELLSV